ncbi:MAG: NAD(P)H-dependent oxidoreductase [Mesonia hippocampi]|uniref:NAD(P)H-dependent oxidoreductase n=1 Tax=Mesonia hippocampi TaxID=1628250 RepID=UPI003F97CBD5
MNHLVIYAHPSENSLNADLRDTVIEQLKEQEENIKVRHLYEMDFKPILSLDDLNGQRRGQVADAAV